MWLSKLIILITILLILLPAAQPRARWSDAVLENAMIKSYKMGFVEAILYTKRLMASNDNVIFSREYFTNDVQADFVATAYCIAWYQGMLKLMILSELNNDE